jgi:hypothetical protein
MWPILHIAILVASVVLGYAGGAFGPERSPVIGAVVGLVGGLAATLVAMRYAASKTAVFRLPSWKRRIPVYWRDDPLQFDSFLTLYVFGVGVGSTIRTYQRGFGPSDFHLGAVCRLGDWASDRILHLP